MTQKDIDEIYKARNSGIKDIYLQDNYVYLVDSDGKDSVFKGINGKLKQETNAPYLLCPKHTKKAWEDYQAKHPAVPDPAPTTPAQGD